MLIFKKVSIVFLLLITIITLSYFSGCKNDTINKFEINPYITNKSCYLCYNNDVYNCSISFNQNKTLDIYFKDYGIGFKYNDEKCYQYRNNNTRVNKSISLNKKFYLFDLYNIFVSSSDNDYTSEAENKFIINYNNNKYKITTDKSGFISGIESKNITLSLN